MEWLQACLVSTYWKPLYPHTIIKEMVCDSKVSQMASTGLLTELINVLAMVRMARCANGVPRDDEQSMIMAHV